ncbi:response regulator [Cucumibacter marinus]|uniref:response regulator n=1 Tax=Cucumibacter marinus TaxID=1121252 RepID=UPI00048F6736|nr:response regulator [Cucumibacter marinus]
MSVKVLYVDDEPDIREIAVMALELNSGFEVKSVDGGRAALAIAAEWQPDVVVLDVMMPDMDGPMTRKALAEQQSTADIPVIFATARTQPTEIEGYRAMNVAGVISKPFDPMTIADQVTSILGADRLG